MNFSSFEIELTPLDLQMVSVSVDGGEVNSFLPRNFISCLSKVVSMASLAIFSFKILFIID